MFDTILTTIAKIILIPLLAILSLAGYTPNLITLDSIAPTADLGATSQTIAGVVYTLSGSGVSGSATTIGLTSLTIPQTGYEIVDSDLPTTFYLTLEPGSRTRQEIVSCTTVAQSGSDTTATLSGCTRGLLPFSPYTASSSYQFAHGGGTSAVFSNPPQLYETLATKSVAQDITGIWTFSSTTIPRLDSYLAPTLDYQFAPKKYADDLVASGVADGNYSTFGGFVLATTSQAIAGTATSTATRYLALPSELSNTTSSAKNIIPVTKTDGKLSQGFLDLTEGFTFSGGVTSTGAFVQSGTSTFSGVNLLTGTTTIKGITYPTSDGQANYYMKTNGSGVLSFDRTSPLIYRNTSDATSTTNNANVVLATTTAIGQGDILMWTGRVGGGAVSYSTALGFIGITYDVLITSVSSTVAASRLNQTNLGCGSAVDATQKIFQFSNGDPIQSFMAQIRVVSVQDTASTTMAMCSSTNASGTGSLIASSTLIKIYDN